MGDDKYSLDYIKKDIKENKISFICLVLLPLIAMTILSISILIEIDNHKTQLDIDEPIEAKLVTIQPAFVDTSYNATDGMDLFIGLVNYIPLMLMVCVSIMIFGMLISMRRY